MTRKRDKPLDGQTSSRVVERSTNIVDTKTSETGAKETSLVGNNIESWVSELPVGKVKVARVLVSKDKTEETTVRVGAGLEASPDGG